MLALANVAVVNGLVCADWDGTGILDNAGQRERNVGRTGHFALQLHPKDLLRIRFKDTSVHELDHGSVYEVQAFRSAYQSAIR